MNSALARRNLEAFQGYSYREPKVNRIQAKEADRKAERRSHEHYSAFWCLDAFENDFLGITATWVYGDIARKDQFS